MGRKKNPSPFLISCLIYTTVVSYSYLHFMVLFLGCVLSGLGRQTPSQGVKYEGLTVRELLSKWSLLLKVSTETKVNVETE